MAKMSNDDALKATTDILDRLENTQDMPESCAVNVRMSKSLLDSDPKFALVFAKRGDYMWKFELMQRRLNGLDTK